MHLIVDNMSDLAEIYRVDDLIVSVLFVAIEILGLTTVAYAKSAMSGLGNETYYQSNGRRGNHLAGHL